MSGRLDQSLDSIIDAQKKAKRDSRRRKAPKPGKATVSIAPVGGVKKTIRPAKPVTKGAATALSAATRDSKIVVSGLPHDVTETQIKEYFQKVVGQVKKVSLQYNQNGQSRGIADVRFTKPGAAAKAAKEQNGVLVDKRPMKIEVVMDANTVPEPPAAKSLSDRVAANPKAQPKSAVATKATAKNAGKPGRDRAGKKGRPTKSNKSKPKTAEELDAEMTDYFASTNGATSNQTAEVIAAATNGGAEPAANTEDLGMDEIS